MKVFSYNIHKGLSPGLQRQTLHRIRDAIRHSHPDVVFLQEVQGETRSGKSQFEYLSHDLWPHTSYGKNAVYVGGHHGNAVLSKFPILSWDNIDLTLNRLERRGLLHVKFEYRKREIHALCTHLNLLEKSRKKQVAKIVKYIETKIPAHEPLLLAGDFNDWRQVVGVELKSRLGMTEVFTVSQGQCARTFPSFMPLVSLDRIYSRGFDVKTVREFSGRPWTQLSDHLPLEAVLGIYGD